MHCLKSLVEGTWIRKQAVSESIYHRVGALARRMKRIGTPADSLVSVFYVPGRIEVLGKHTDYAGGRGLVCATEQGMCLLAHARTDNLVQMIDIRREQTASFSVAGGSGEADPHWSIYPKTVVSRVSKILGRAPLGMEVVFESDLPAASGLSSSSVLVIGTFLTLAKCNDLEADPRWVEMLSSPEDLAGFLGAVESGRPFRGHDSEAGVGTRGGDQDHVAILCSRPVVLSQFRYLPTVKERQVAVPDGLVFVIGVSGVQASKTGKARADYNRVSCLAADLEAVLKTEADESSTTLGSILQRGSAEMERLQGILESRIADHALTDELSSRLVQFFQESEEIVPGAGDALERGDLDRFRACVDRSMVLAEKSLGNQIEETLWLVERALDLGAVAASAFGAGFGGSVWALVPDHDSGRFLDRWSSSYLVRFPEHRSGAAFFETAAASAAVEL